MNDCIYHHGILGQKWGVRRYQNEDGTLTEAGKKRYDRDVRENLAKKKDNRIDTSSPDPSRWEREDLERKKKVVDTTAAMNKQLQNIELVTRPTSTKTKLDLSGMSDKELRDRINRELLEQQYNKLFTEESQSTISKGRQAVTTTLDLVGTALAVTSSAISIALAIRELKG